MSKATADHLFIWLVFIFIFYNVLCDQKIYKLTSIKGIWNFVQNQLIVISLFVEIVSTKYSILD